MKQVVFMVQFEKMAFFVTLKKILSLFWNEEARIILKTLPDIQIFNARTCWGICTLLLTGTHYLSAQEEIIIDGTISSELEKNV